eukprot:TRINITY_DN1361_c0_g1_i1.p1 TRINITY_DN1361_c0_g1~~TRINITY_DN1361_c0_g1_i1.p1  ORF type:complete len:195 (-),score=58.66 TRINITY_DN1361_c0_g1_i1:62-646(-)
MIRKAFKIVIDPFAYRQFEKKEGAQNVIEYGLEEFQERINQLYDPSQLADGYAPFCKHLFVKNFTTTKMGYAKITKENEHLLRTVYEARTEKELPVLRRFFPYDNITPQVAEYLDIILYHRTQVEKENAAMGNQDPNKDIDYEWGIVSIKPQDCPHELPMDPITIMRNALGVEHGGSGVPLDREKYLKLSLIHI